MKKNSTILILTFGVFSIINTEMGIIGILPMIADYFQVSMSDAGLMVSLFALGVALAGPTMPLLFSGMNKQYSMLLVLGMFFVCNMISAFTTSFPIALMARVLPAFFHPIYVSLAFHVASSSVSEQDAPKAVSKVMMGVSAGMVLGVPVVSFIANHSSLRFAMLFFALISAIAFILSILWIPSMPVKEKLSYGKQLSCLKHSLTWISILAVVFLNGSIFGIYSFFADYLGRVTGMSQNLISSMLLLYGLANIVGNIIGGKGLSSNPIRFILGFPLFLCTTYGLLFLFGSFSVATIILTSAFGILAGIAGNINQYWITSIVHDAPEFGNGLFLAATNLGTTMGTTICGLLITTLGTRYIILGGITLLLGSMALILYRVRIQHKQA